MAHMPNAVWMAGVGGLLVGAAGTWLLVAQPLSAGASERERSMARLDYVELPVEDMAATRTFYERAFGWSMTQFAPTYAATTTNDTDIGLASDPAERPEVPIAVIQVRDLEAALASVERAGGRIVRPIFAFPGGRRFEFTDPSGNRLGVWQPAAE